MCGSPVASPVSAAGSTFPAPVGPASVPVFQGKDLKIVSRSPATFEGRKGVPKAPWFGRMTIDIGDELYTLDEFLSAGDEGQAYTMTRLGTGETFVAKFCSTSFRGEVNVVMELPPQLLESEHVVNYELVVLNVSEVLSPAQHVIMMQHVPNGDLFDLIKFQDPSVGAQALGEGTSRRILHSLIRAMAECYRLGLAHRDLKPENALLNAHGRVVIIDLGHAKQVHGSGAPDAVPLTRATTSNMYGTEGFRAPEVRKVSKVRAWDCEMADVWSVGVIAFMMYTKLPAFVVGRASPSDASGLHNIMLWRKLRFSGWYEPFPPEGLQKFINALWQKDPFARPSFSQMERAILGDADILAEFPGLQWLAQPVNDEDAFIAELQRCCPGKAFRAPCAEAVDSETQSKSQ